ncbi:DUF6493 family protein [Actinoplanes sp. NPDC024001]|uniref:DUF7824 domain-containing protein n=1 Tax=Actinoplanes sp. NPDC024001 TaxID=3154598 RepID=UPI0033D82A59
MSSRLSWQALDRSARAGDLDGIAGLLLSATEDERLAAAKPVEAGIRAVDTDLWWRSDISPTPGWALAVIGCMPTAARAAALLGRRGMQTWSRTSPDRFLTVARARELTWLGDLGVRLAERLPVRDVWFEDWRFAAALLRAGGADPPVTEGFVRGWLNQLLRAHQPVPSLRQRLRGDPFLDRLLPGVFEIDGLGADAAVGHLSPRTGSWDATPRFPSVIADLVAEGRLERKVIVDATVDRLVRGDRASALRPFVLLHEALALTTDELATYAPDYARLLPDAPSAVAGPAQRALRAVDDAGRLELRTLLEVSAATLVRTEKTLVRAQLSWLERVLRREPQRAADILRTVAAAFGHPAPDIQERALTLIGRHRDRLDPATLADLGEAAGALAGDLPARAADLLGVPAVAPAPAVPGLPPVLPVAEVPPPISGVAELREEIVLLMAEETALRWERVLAALIALRGCGLAEALAPLLDRPEFTEQAWMPQHRLVLLGEAIRALGGRGQRMLPALTAGQRGGPGSVLAARIAEVGVELSRSPVPLLLATPTHVNGSLDASVLLERLARIEADGRQPWQLDLHQALLRVPRQADPALAARAARLTSPAGRQFAAWLAEGGMPDPVSTRLKQRIGSKSLRPAHDRTVVPSRVLATLRPARTGGLPWEERLLTLDRPALPRHRATDPIAETDILTMVLPHHREATAAWALVGLAGLADQDQRGGGHLLPLLAECTGPVGPAMTLALAYTLAARHEADRVAGVDAFLTLAAGPEPFAAALGAELGHLCGPDSLIKLTRVVPALADAHRAGATAAVWDVLLHALPLLLPKSPRGLPDLLSLATQVARAVHGRADMPELAAVAGRNGTSRLFREARRLQTVLAG